MEIIFLILILGGSYALIKAWIDTEKDSRKNLIQTVRSNMHKLVGEDAEINKDTFKSLIINTSDDDIQRYLDTCNNILEVRDPYITAEAIIYQWKGGKFYEYVKIRSNLKN